MTVTRGIEVWTEVERVLIGTVEEAFSVKGITYVRCRTIRGEIFERPLHQIHNIRELYKV